MSGHEMMRNATSEPHPSDLASTRKSPSMSYQAIDHLIWGLDGEDCARIYSLYDEGRALVASYCKVQDDIETRKKWLESRIIETEDQTALSFSSESESDSDSDRSDFEQEIYLSLTKIKRAYDRDIELCRLMRVLEAANGPIDKVATICANLQLCPSFTAIILSKLPPELRDYVYDYLWTEEHIESMDKAISYAPNFHFSDVAVANAPDLPVPRFANAAFVGVEFATEAAVRYFRNLSNAEIDYRYARFHLERDHFGPMAFAVRDVIQRLVMTIDDGYGNNYSVMSMSYMALKDSMDSLLMLKDNRNIGIEISLEAGMQWSSAFYQTLEVIKPVFLMLSEANVNIKVLGYDFFSTNDDDGANIFSEQLNYYLTAGTPEEWVDMKAKEIKNMPQGPLRQRCKRTLRTMRKNLDFFMQTKQKAA